MREGTFFDTAKASAGMRRSSSDARSGNTIFRYCSSLEYYAETKIKMTRWDLFAPDHGSMLVVVRLWYHLS